jgi:hypothetical protein
MVKVINKYRGYTAATIKSRASIPNQADMTVVGDTVECVAINSTKIRNATLGSSNQLHASSIASNVNLWSGFGPVRRREVNGILVNDVVSPDEMGEFAGYNHNAPIPSFYNSAHLVKKYVASGGTATFTADIVIGEPKYIGGDITNHGNCLGICLTAWDGANLVGFGYSDTSLSNSQNSVSLSCDVPNCSLNKIYTFKIFLTDSETVFNQDGSNIICQIPGLDDYTAETEILLPSTYNLQAGSFTVSNPGLYGFSDAFNSVDVPGLEINIRLVSQLYGLIDNIIWYPNDYIDPPHDGWYPANYHTGTCMPTLNGGIPIPDYGYVLQILFNEPF